MAQSCYSSTGEMAAGESGAWPPKCWDSWKEPFLLASCIFSHVGVYSSDFPVSAVMALCKCCCLKVLPLFFDFV